MSELQDPVTEDMERLSQEDFYEKYCTDGDDGCDECARIGVCCISCKHNAKCKDVCDSEKQRQKIDTKPIKELADMVMEHEESLLMLVVSDKLIELAQEVEIMRSALGNEKNCLTSECLKCAYEQAKSHKTGEVNICSCDKTKRIDAINKALEGK